MGTIHGSRSFETGTHPLSAQALTWRVWARDGVRLLAAEGVRMTATVKRMLKLWQARARGRSDLTYLDARLLCDIGMTSEQAERESRKPFWRA